MKVLVLPNDFDMNEWIILVALIAVYALFFLLPQRFPKTITMLIYMFSISLEKATDLILEYPPYVLYYLNDSMEFELFDFLTCFLYPAFGYLMLYVYDKWNVRGITIFFYLMAWSIFAVLFEWMMMKVRIFNYTGWTLFHSYAVYLLVVGLYIAFFHFVKYFFKKTMKESFGGLRN
ncbi:hypothetical protein [Cohnella sp.]|uniref:hypothetical protein n=1 Tax=Cohnella sp. TaxID=1883426 RepID=UPI003561864A